MKFINLVGQEFGELEVIERAENDKHGNSRYLCRCSCGKEIIVDSSALKRGRKTSCGHKYQIEIGSKYGKLTVIKEIKNGGKYSYLCLCECGNVFMMGLCAQIQQGPAKHSHQKGNCRLVDFGDILHRDHDVAYDEDTDDSSRHNLYC